MRGSTTRLWPWVLTMSLHKVARGSMLPAQPAAKSRGTLPLRQVLSTVDDSLKRTLKADPQSDKEAPNTTPREVFGQWVAVEPTALPDPFVVALAPAMAAELGLDPSSAEEASFASFFSGNVAGARSDGISIQPWATPYAVSVFGQPIPSPDPFGGGNAYGDGRAVSLGEFLAPVPDAATQPRQRWELQLKGSGTTPFSRGGDGRAVLRSSVREFLVSEAMHAMGVPTTRALCLVASGSQYTRRLWYANDDKERYDHPPDTMVTERCAITCRAAPSFLRVGHLELWQRRAGRGVDGAAAELKALVEHALGREFADEVNSSLPWRDRLFAMVRVFAKRQAVLSVNWLRVGYVQGNMNSDNCLLSGRTMDYGPFGFLERYEPLWSPFTSDMERKFGFERQPFASQVNLMTLARALLPLFEREDNYEAAVAELQSIVETEYPELLKEHTGEMYRAKLGLAAWDEDAQEHLWPQLQALLAKSGIDYTLFWRQLASISASDAAAAAEAAEEDAPADAMLAHLTPCFFEDAPKDPVLGEWRRWLRKYATRMVSDGRADTERQTEMRATSPKYVPREWILAEAYTRAEKGDFSIVNELMTVFGSPFEEHSDDMARKYYRLPPTDMEKKAGISFFS